MKFVFRLEKMLHYVRLRETVKKMEVATVVKRLQFLEGRQRMLEENLRTSLEMTGREGDLTWAPYHHLKVTADVQEGKKVEKLVIEERGNLEMRQAELSRILMRKKALETLREKRYAEFRLDQSRKEQKRLDEVYQLTHAEKE